VLLQVDGTDVGTADTTSPYTFSLNITALSNGSHSLTAVATDPSGNQATSAAVSITVSNQGTGAEPAYANNGAGCPINTVPGGPTDSVTSYNCPLPNPTGAGNLLVIWLRYYAYNPAATVSFSTNLGPLTVQTATTKIDVNTVSTLYYVPNVAGGINVVSVNFSSYEGYVQMQPYEFYNVATTSPLDQAASEAGTGTSISSGALSSLAASGDLVVHFGFFDDGTTISSCVSNSLANISWQMRAALITGPEPMCFQYGVYNDTASLDPTMTFSSSGNYVSLSAAFKAASAGTPPPAGIRVNYIQHDDGGSEGGSSFAGWLPVSGNLIVEMNTAGCYGLTLSTCAYATGMSDGTNNWTQIGSTYVSTSGVSTNAVGSIWYAAGVSPGFYHLVMPWHPRSGSTFPVSWLMFDISGASANPLDLNFGGAGDGLASMSQNWTTSAPSVSFTVTPTYQDEVVLAEIGAESDTFTGLSSPTGGNFVSAHYTGETNYSWTDLNGGWGMLYNRTSTAAETWTWTHDSSQFPGPGRGLALGAAFK
jgi:hypothetical protein